MPTNNANLLTTDLLVHVFWQWLLTHFCNSKNPINLNHTNINEKYSRYNIEGYNKLKKLYFRGGDISTLFPGWTAKEYSRIRL
jgi:hypothetical protein